VFSVYRFITRRDDNDDLPGKQTSKKHRVQADDQNGPETGRNCANNAVQAKLAGLRDSKLDGKSERTRRSQRLSSRSDLSSFQQSHYTTELLSHLQPQQIGIVLPVHG